MTAEPAPGSGKRVLPQTPQSDLSTTSYVHHTTPPHEIRAPSHQLLAYSGHKRQSYLDGYREFPRGDPKSMHYLAGWGLTVWEILNRFTGSSFTLVPSREDNCGICHRLGGHQNLRRQRGLRRWGWGLPWWRIKRKACIGGVKGRW